MTAAPAARRLVRPPGGKGGGPAARSPFVLLTVALMAGGLIGLLVLNAAVNQDSFTLGRLRKQTDQLRDEEQALQQEVDQYSAPGALDKRARRLGMVPGGSPAFLSPDGTVRGDPSPAAAPPYPSPVPPASPASSVSPVPPVSAASPGSSAPASPASLASPASPASPASGAGAAAQEGP